MDKHHKIKIATEKFINQLKITKKTQQNDQNKFIESDIGHMRDKIVE